MIRYKLSFPEYYLNKNYLNKYFINIIFRVFLQTMSWLEKVLLSCLALFIVFMNCNDAIPLILLLGFVGFIIMVS